MAHHSTDPIVVAFAELGRIEHSETSPRRGAEQGRRAGTADAARRRRGVRDARPRPRGPYTAAFTGELTLELDEWQCEQDGGPCLQAAAEKTTATVPDTATDPRWSGWALRVGPPGVGGRCGQRVPGRPAETRRRKRGTQHLWPEARSVRDEAAVLAQTFAGYAAVSPGKAHEYHTVVSLARHLRTVMESRALIEQAKGIIMGERRVSAEEAFAVLTKVSPGLQRRCPPGPHVRDGDP
jgi:hypothetical protein